MQIPLLYDIVIIFCLAIVVLLVCRQFRVPTVVGFLLTGICVGPYGLGIVTVMHEVEVLAEIGVVLLLFTIGIEFSLQRLVQIRKSILLGGSLQVMLTVLVVFGIARYLEQGIGISIFIGFLVALSSTAIVLKIVQERAEVDSPQGRTVLGILVFQDIIIVPMILVTPFLSGISGHIGETLFIFAAKGAGIILLVLISAKWIVPNVLYQIARTRNQELFLISVVVICFGVAWLTSMAGLSLALGAFLAGLIISESDYSHQALGNIVPFRDIFTTFFFVSIGMLLDLEFLLRQPVFILTITVTVLMIKAIIAGSVTQLLGYSLRTGIMVGFALCQIGEFSFILSRVGIEHGVLTGDVYQTFLAVSVLSMAATPFLIALSPRIADIILKLPVPNRLRTGFFPVSQTTTVKRTDHLVIIGFGINGRNVARAAKVAGIPYAVIEMNPETVRREQAAGEPAIYGDATQEAVLQHADIGEARIVVVGIHDPAATRRIITLIRRLNTQCHLIIRTRFVEEMQPLLKMGADEVIPEEFETSVEIFTRVLVRYIVPRDEIEKMVKEVRADGYEMFRSLSRTPVSISDLNSQLYDVDVSARRISEVSPLDGKTIGQTEMRKRCGVSIVAIRRGTQLLSNPGADTLLQANDIVYLLGAAVNISEATNILATSPDKSADL